MWAGCGIVAFLWASFCYIFCALKRQYKFSLTFLKRVLYNFHLSFVLGSRHVYTKVTFYAEGQFKRCLTMTDVLKIGNGQRVTDDSSWRVRKCFFLSTSSTFFCILRRFIMSDNLSFLAQLTTIQTISDDALQVDSVTQCSMSMMLAELVTWYISSSK